MSKYVCNFEPFKDVELEGNAIVSNNGDRFYHTPNKFDKIIGFSCWTSNLSDLIARGLISEVKEKWADDDTLKDFHRYIMTTGQHANLDKYLADFKKEKGL